MGNEGERKPSISNDRVYSSNDISEKRAMGSNDQIYAKMLAHIDKREILCSVCKAFLRRIKPDGIVSNLANVHPCEVLYECKNGHVFSGETVVYLYLKDDFRSQ